MCVVLCLHKETALPQGAYNLSIRQERRCGYGNMQEEKITEAIVISVVTSSHSTHLSNHWVFCGYTAEVSFGGRFEGQFCGISGGVAYTVANLHLNYRSNRGRALHPIALFKAQCWSFLCFWDFCPQEILVWKCRRLKKGKVQFLLHFSCLNIFISAFPVGNRTSLWNVIPLVAIPW